MKKSEVLAIAESLRNMGIEHPSKPNLLSARQDLKELLKDVKHCLADEELDVSDSDVAEFSDEAKEAIKNAGGLKAFKKAKESEPEPEKKGKTKKEPEPELAKKSKETKSKKEPEPEPEVKKGKTKKGTEPEPEPKKKSKKEPEPEPEPEPEKISFGTVAYQVIERKFDRNTSFAVYEADVNKALEKAGLKVKNVQSRLEGIIDFISAMGICTISEDKEGNMKFHCIGIDVNIE